jgi:polysaccharide deacetylase family protein (PEP-CTERM system associated)
MHDTRNVLSIDVEDWFQVEGFATVIRRDEWPSFELRVERNVDIILEELAAASTHGTFFVLGWVAERLPRMVERIAQAGHEIASHGWSHTPVWRLTPEQFMDEIVRSRALLATLSGQPVVGYRAPTFSVTKETLWALPMLASAGYVYDSSIFPIRHDRYGIPDAPLGIHRREGIWELPMSVCEIGSFRLPVAGGGYFRLYPRVLTSMAIRHMNRAGRPAIVYLHPWEFDPGQPKPAGASSTALLRHRLNLAGTRGKLRRLMAEFSFAPARDLLGSL